ncbi:hypothetical protein [Clostridium tagluense]|uniref:Uncharacterized protein n=1 Tax=Clostridium tagluense TaxID=360422 RepID=A0A401UJT3_9CLOT|nr:hypothetical protein Ctaglu_14290 [Clostridium tagluense]
MDMNGLLSGLASAQNNGCDHNKKCCCNNNNNNGIFGGSSIILIIILLCFCGGFGGQGQDCGTVCGCDPKHCKELCRCGPINNGGCGGFGGFGSGNGCWWIIILILLCTCGNQNRGCGSNNDDCCDE